MKRSLLAALALVVAGTAQAITTEFIIFKDPNFQGEKDVIKGEVANLEKGFAQRGSSLIVRGGFWEVCTGDHFTGECYALNAGEYPWLGFLDDRIVAVKFLGMNPRLAGRTVLEAGSPRLAMGEVPALRQQRLAEQRRLEQQRLAEQQRRDRGEFRFSEGAIDLYGRPDFRGRSVRIDDNKPDLWEERFDGRASSAIVHEGTWQLCSEPGFRGRCSVLRPGEYPQLAQLDDRVSSVRRLR